MNKYKEALESICDELRSSRRNDTNLTHMQNSVYTLQELVDKSIPKKPKHHHWFYDCPICEASVFDDEYSDRFDYCKNCGQKIDWSEDETR